MKGGTFQEQLSAFPKNNLPIDLEIDSRLLSSN
jgi:hypothetical protein